METNQFSGISEKCQNFKNYLQNSFELENFGNFVCAYKFSLEEINSLINSASENAVPTSLRVYYGCDTDGNNHQFFIAVLDAEDNVLQAQSIPTNTNNDLESTVPSSTAKCPPGCRNDVIIRSIM